MRKRIAVLTIILLLLPMISVGGQTAGSRDIKIERWSPLTVYGWLDALSIPDREAMRNELRRLVVSMVDNFENKYGEAALWVFTGRPRGISKEYAYDYWENVVDSIIGACVAYYPGYGFRDNRKIISIENGRLRAGETTASLWDRYGGTVFGTFRSQLLQDVSNYYFGEGENVPLPGTSETVNSIFSNWSFIVRRWAIIVSFRGRNELWYYNPTYLQQDPRKPPTVTLSNLGQLMGHSRHVPGGGDVYVGTYYKTYGEIRPNIDGPDEIAYVVSGPGGGRAENIRIIDAEGSRKTVVFFTIYNPGHVTRDGNVGVYLSGRPTQMQEYSDDVYDYALNSAVWNTVRNNILEVFRAEVERARQTELSCVRNLITWKYIDPALASLCTGLKDVISRAAALTDNGINLLCSRINELGAGDSSYRSGIIASREAFLEKAGRMYACGFDAIDCAGAREVVGRAHQVFVSAKNYLDAQKVENINARYNGLLDSVARLLSGTVSVPPATYSSVKDYYDNISATVDIGQAAADNLLNLWKGYMENMLNRIPLDNCRRLENDLRARGVPLLNENVISTAVKYARYIRAGIGDIIVPVGTREENAPASIVALENRRIMRLAENRLLCGGALDNVVRYIRQGTPLRWSRDLPRPDDNDYEEFFGRVSNNLVNMGNDILEMLLHAEALARYYASAFDNFYEQNAALVENRIYSSRFYTDGPENYRNMVNSYVDAARVAHETARNLLSVDNVGHAGCWAAEAVINLGYAYLLVDLPFIIINDVTAEISGRLATYRKYYELVSGIYGRHQENRSRFLDIPDYATIVEQYRLLENIENIKRLVENSENYYLLSTVLWLLVGGGTQTSPAVGSLAYISGQYASRCSEIARKYAEHLTSLYSYADRALSFLEAAAHPENFATYRTALQRYSGRWWETEETMLERRRELYVRPAVEDNLWEIIDNLKAAVGEAGEALLGAMETTISVTLPQVVYANRSENVVAYCTIHNTIGLEFVDYCAKKITLPVFDNLSAVREVKDASGRALSYRLENGDTISVMVKPSGAEMENITITYSTVVVRSDIPAAGLTFLQVQERIEPGVPVRFAASATLTTKDAFLDPLNGTQIFVCAKVPRAITRTPCWPPALFVSGTMDNGAVFSAPSEVDIRISFVWRSTATVVPLTIYVDLPPVYRKLSSPEFEISENLEDIRVTYSVSYSNKTDMAYENVVVSETAYLALAPPEVSVAPPIQYTVSEWAGYYTVSGVTGLPPSGTVLVTIQFRLPVSTSVYDYYYSLAIQKRDDIASKIGERYVADADALIQAAEGQKPFFENFELPGHPGQYVTVVNRERLSSALQYILQAIAKLENIDVQYIQYMSAKCRELEAIIDALLNALRRDCTVLDNIRQIVASTGTIHSRLTNCYNTNSTRKLNFVSLRQAELFEDAVAVANGIIASISENRASAIYEIGEIMVGWVSEKTAELQNIKERIKRIERLPLRMGALMKPPIIISSPSAAENLLENIRGVRLADGLSVLWPLLKAVVDSIADTVATLVTAEAAAADYIRQGIAMVEADIGARLATVRESIDNLSEACRLTVTDGYVISLARRTWPSPPLSADNLAALLGTVREIEDRVYQIKSALLMEASPADVIKTYLSMEGDLNSAINGAAAAESVVNSTSKAWYSLANSHVQLAKAVVAGAGLGENHRAAIYVRQAESSLAQWRLLDAMYYAEAARRMAEGVHAPPAEESLAIKVIAAVLLAAAVVSGIFVWRWRCGNKPKAAPAGFSGSSGADGSGNIL